MSENENKDEKKNEEWDRGEPFSLILYSEDLLLLLGGLHMLEHSGSSDESFDEIAQVYEDLMKRIHAQIPKEPSGAARPIVLQYVDRTRDCAFLDLVFGTFWAIEEKRSAFAEAKAAEIFEALEEASRDLTAGERLVKDTEDKPRQ